MLASYFRSACSVADRLEGVRVVMAVVIMILMIFGPYGSVYTDHQDLLQRFGWFAVPLSAQSLLALRALTFAASLVLLSGRFARSAAAITAIGFFILNAYVSGFDGLWNYNAHLNFMLFALCFIRRSAETSRQILFGIYVIVALVYFQAGLSKLLHGGWEWMISGRTIRTYAVLIGTDLGRYLTGFPVVFKAMTLASVPLELMLGVAFLVPRLQRPAAMIAVLFHLGIYSILGISFWHLWIFYPVLFTDASSKVKLWRSASSSAKIPMGNVKIGSV